MAVLVKNFNSYNNTLLINNLSATQVPSNSVTPLFSKSFIIRGIGYRAQLISNNWGKDKSIWSIISTIEFPGKRYLSIRAGYSYNLYIPIPDYLGVLISKKDRKLVLYSSSKALLFSFATSVLKIRPPSVYTGRGIRIKGVAHKRKIGKTDARKGKFF